MSQPSSIDRLPSEVREALQGWLRDPAITQTEATERTNALLDELAAQQPEGKPAEYVSRQAVNRYDQRMRAACERLAQSRQVTEVWADKLGSVPAGQFGHIVTEMLRMLVFDLAYQIQGLQDRVIDEKSLPGIVASANKVSLMAQRLERSSEIAVRRDREIKRQAAEEAEKAKAARRVPATPEKVREVIREIYGV
ncbi:MAG: DUF3486 family protein [Bryobacterales bacterium]|nr:DUF3486 family protein [Bryobacterales bacterium]MDE0295651.1 DUF3486 family protein [Bryobacterales bacterium]